MDKTKILFISPGASVSFAGTSLGYTSGISIVPENETTPIYNQRYKGAVDSKFTAIGATIRVNLMEFSSANYGLLPLTDSATLTKGVLIVYGKRKDGKFITVTMNSAYVESIGEITLDKSENSILPLVWRCLLDSSGILGSISES